MEVVAIPTYSLQVIPNMALADFDFMSLRVTSNNKFSSLNMH